MKTKPGVDVPRWERLGPERRREQILAVARRRFASKPYSAVSTAEIADEAGVNRGLIHHYFGTKRDLYLAVLKDAVLTPMVPEVDPSSVEDVAARFSSDVDIWLEYLAANRDIFMLAVGPEGSFGRDPEVESILRDAREWTARAFLQRIAGIHAEPSPPILSCVMALGGLVQTAVFEWLDGERLTQWQARELIVQTALHLLANIDRILAAEPHPASAATR